MSPLPDLGGKSCYLSLCNSKQTSVGVYQIVQKPGFLKVLRTFDTETFDTVTQTHLLTSDE